MCLHFNCHPHLTRQPHKTAKPYLPATPLNHPSLAGSGVYQDNVWQKMELDMIGTRLFVVEATRGGRTNRRDLFDRGDIAIDDFELLNNNCSQNNVNGEDMCTVVALASTLSSFHVPRSRPGKPPV